MREGGGQILQGGDTKKGTDRRCRACLEPVYESWAINRIVYSIVAATGSQQPEGKTQRRARLPLQAWAAVNTHREKTQRGCPRKSFSSTRYH